MKETKSETAIAHKFVDITKINNANNMDKPIFTVGSLTYKESIPFMGYSEVKMSCEPDDSKSMCNNCINARSGACVKTFSAESPHLLKFMSLPEEKVQPVLKTMANVPSKCSLAKFSTSGSKINITRGILNPSTSEVGSLVKDVENLCQVEVQIAFLGDPNQLDVNSDYSFYGYLQREPKTGKAILVADKAMPVADDIKSFQMTDEVEKALKRFQSEELTKESVKARYREIANELKCNYHKINGREDVAFWQTLAFTSCLDFRYGTIDDEMNRGWLEVAVVGDSRTGKSQIAKGLMKAFGVGTKISGESVTFPGLVGGVNESGSGNKYVSWGIFPKNDKRIVILDEIHNSEARPVLRQLNELRSSGEAHVTKIIQNKTMARVRKLFIANPPREGATTQSYDKPVEMLLDLFGTAESIARLDMFVAPSKTDVPDTEVKMVCNAVREYFGPHFGTLIKYIYSRTHEQVVIHDDVRDYINEESTRLCRKYHGIQIPLIDQGDSHFKIARGSSSLAGLTASWDPSDRELIVVSKAHVEVVVEAIEANYDGFSTGYLDYSKYRNRLERFANFNDFFNACCKVKNDFGRGNQEIIHMIKDHDSIPWREIREIWPNGKNKVSKVLVDVKGGMHKSGKYTKTERGRHIFRFLSGLDDNEELVKKADAMTYFNRYLV